MNHLISLILICLLISSIKCAIVCTPNICNAIDCVNPIRETCESDGAHVYVPNGGMCGCCALCVHLLSEGELCASLLIRGGGPPESRCADGLACSQVNNTCVKRDV